MTMEGKCDVCGLNPPVGVASSPFAACSFAYCRECLQKQAEPAMIFEYLYCEVAHGDVKNLRPEINNWYTFVDGTYIIWSAWVARYGEAAYERMLHAEVSEMLKNP